MSISIGPAPILDDLILWYDAANYKCYSGEPTTNQFSRDYYGESGVSTGDASLGLSGLFGLGIISQRPWSHEVWSLDNINKGKLTRYGAYYFDGINDYLEVPDDDKFTFGQDNVITYTSDFSAGVNGWAASQGTADGNIDSIGGQDNNLRLTVDTNSGQHFLSKSGLVNGKTYKVSFDYYIPSSQSNIDGIRAGYNGGNNAFGQVDSPTLGVWNSLSGEAVAGNTSLIIFAQDGGNTNFQDAGGNDVFYIRNVQITEVKDDLPFSISAWIKMEDATSSVIISKFGAGAGSREWTLHLDSEDNLNLLLLDGSANQEGVKTSSTLTSYEGQWVHIIATYGGSGPNSSSAFTAASSEITLYIDGQTIAITENSSGTYTGMTNTSKSVTIGQRNSSDFFQGHIKNVKIFNRELSATEVSNLYNYNTINGPSLVDFADEWDGASIGSIDSTVGVSSWTGTGSVTLNNLTETANQTIDGNTGTLKLEATSTSTGNTRFFITQITAPNKRARIQFSYYIPSTNTTIDQFYLIHTDGATIQTMSTTDSWTTVIIDYHNNTGGTNTIQLVLTDGGAFNATSGDYIAIKGFTITKIGILADFDLANYDDNDKITDKSSNKFIASPQGGALARDRWFAHDLSFSKDKDNNDIATITRNPASGAFYENTNSLTLFGEHPLYITNASTGDKVSISLQTKSNLTGLFTGINFFNSGTSAHESVILNRITLPDNYEYIYGTSNLIATGDNVGFELLMNRSMSSGWNFISLRKPQTELKDHATNFTSFSRTGTNAIINLANRNQYAGTITNDVKSSGIAKMDGVESFVPLINGYWEFNGVDTNINTSFVNYNDLSKEFTIEFVFLIDTTGQNNTLAGFNDYPYFYGSSSSANKLQFFYNATSKQGETELTISNKQHAVFQASNITKSGNLYLNGQFDGGFSFSGLNPADTSTIYIGDKGPSEAPFDGRIFLARYYDKFLTPDQINHNYRSIKTKYGL